jgi:cytochrome c
MKYAVFGLVLTGLAVSVPAHANEAMAKKYNCLACHTVDKRSVGPAYKDVAKKYAGQAGAEAKLADKIKKGGAGVWGPTPMPPNASVPDADIKALAKWVLSLK